MIPHCGISNCGVFMEFLYSITTYKCGVYNIPEKLQMITTCFTYYGTNLVFPVPRVDTNLESLENSGNLKNCQKLKENSRKFELL